jgi:hypothetical protein
MLNTSLSSILLNNINIKPGEYFPTYFYRLMEYADFFAPKEFLSLFQISSPRLIGETMPRWAVKFVVQAYGRKRFENVLTDNMVGKYWQGFVSRDVLNVHVKNQLNDKATGRVLFNAEKLLMPYHSLKYCSKCHDEDVSTKGFVIWKAEHQAMSAFICQQHNTALSQRLVSEFNGVECSGDFFDKSSFSTPHITLFHRWLDWETKLLMRGGVDHQREQVELHKRVFMESSFYSHSPSKASVALNKQWQSALCKYLIILFPNSKCSAKTTANNNAFKASAIMSEDGSIHPFMFLLFKFFYLFEYQP